MKNPRVNLSSRAVGYVFVIGFTVLGGMLYKRFGRNGLIVFLKISLVVFVAIASVSISYLVIKFIISITSAVGETRRWLQDQKNQVMDEDCDDN